MEFTKNNPDWWKHLVKGDIIQCKEEKIKNSSGFVAGKKFIYTNRSLSYDSGGIIWKTEDPQQGIHDCDCFPIKMKKFPELNVKDNYDIY